MSASSIGEKYLFHGVYHIRMGPIGLAPCHDTWDVVVVFAKEDIIQMFAVPQTIISYKDRPITARTARFFMTKHGLN